MAKRLTIEELDKRLAAKREQFLARKEKAEEAKAAREAGKTGKRKLEILEAFLQRHGLALGWRSQALNDEPSGIAVFWHNAWVGTLGAEEEAA